MTPRVMAAARRRTLWRRSGTCGSARRPRPCGRESSQRLLAGRLRHAQATPVPRGGRSRGRRVRRLGDIVVRTQREQAPDPGHHQPTAAPARPEATPYGGVTYEDPGANPFVDPDEDGVSTFALDIDTASYTIAQRYIGDGNRPDPASVRVEEWVNAFDQGYRAPSDDDFAIIVDGGPTPFVEDDEVLVRIGLQARAVRDRAREDASLTFVIDTSGSMARESRLELVKDSLRILVDELGPDDRVAVVEFGQDARLVLEFDIGAREGPDPRRDRRAPTERLHEPRGGPAARLRAGPRVAHRERHRPGGPRLGRRRQRRAHRRRRDPAPHPRRRGGRHRAGQRRSRHGQLQRHPARAARRPGRRVLRLRQRHRRGPDALPRRPDLDPPDRRPRREGAGRIRSRPRRGLPARRVREPRHRRRLVHRSRRRRRGDRRRPHGDRALCPPPAPGRQRGRPPRDGPPPLVRPGERADPGAGPGRAWRRPRPLVRVVRRALPLRRDRRGDRRGPARQPVRADAPTSRTSCGWPTRRPAACRPRTRSTTSWTSSTPHARLER